ncbi:MAG: class I SAM-dependent methyltransferase [Candidatus Hermodarchaeota archaeon]
MLKKKFKLDPKKRFSSRVENYIKYRPNYPPEIVKYLKEIDILKDNSIIADIGSGTGILSEVFLQNGNIVYGIEPNADMRKAAEKLLETYYNFISIDGSAEDTKLKVKSIDIITVGQAFHWFDIKQTQKEFKRILKQEGYVVLIWNNRKKSGNGFSSEYEKFILKYGKDYKFTRKDEADINKFFKYEKEVFYNYQDFDFEGLKGRLLSASYIPLEDNPEYEDMIKELENIFNKYQHDGLIRLEYDTELYYGNL